MIKKKKVLKEIILKTPQIWQKNVSIQIQDILENSKQDEPKEIHTKRHHNKTSEIERPRKYLGSSARQVTPFLYGENNSDDSEFLIRNQEGQKDVEKHFFEC